MHAGKTHIGRCRLTELVIRIMKTLFRFSLSLNFALKWLKSGWWQNCWWKLNDITNHIGDIFAHSVCKISSMKFSTKPKLSIKSQIPAKKYDIWFGYQWKVVLRKIMSQSFRPCIKKPVMEFMSYFSCFKLFSFWSLLGTWSSAKSRMYFLILKIAL